MDKIKVLELKLKIKTEECETYKKLLENQSKNTLDANRANLKAIVSVCSASVVCLAFIVGFFIYCYFNTNYQYGEYTDNSNTITNSKNTHIKEGGE